MAFISALTILSLRYWVLPNIENYRMDIARAASRVLGQPVSIAGISAHWQRSRPHLQLQGVQIYDSKHRPALFLENVETSLSWASLGSADVRLHTFIIHKPVLSIRRESSGLIYMAGVPINGPPGETTFGDWLLRQREIIVENATVEWRDEKRNAAPVSLLKVNLRWVNRSRQHRFGLTASPPRDIGSPFALRGILHGSSLADFSGWRGELYAAIDRTDLGLLGRWVPYPFELSAGEGGVRLWLDFKNRTLSSVIANVNLHKVEARLRPELPAFEIYKLSGLLAWKDLLPGYHVDLKGLTLNASNNLNLSNSTAQFRYIPAPAGKPVTWEFKTPALRLESLDVLANYLPLEGEAAQILGRLALKGSVSDFSGKWEGMGGETTRLSVKGKFNNLGFNSYQKWPGVAGLSGSIDTTEKNGDFVVDTQNVALLMPQVFPEVLRLQKLNSRGSWASIGAGYQIKLPRVSFSNAHMAGTATLTYSGQTGKHGEIELSSELTRADARYVWHYLPYVIHGDVHNWVKTSLLGGSSNQVKAYIKGDLAHFPFSDGKPGVFQLKAKFSDGILDYAPGWPRLENARGNLVFENKKMLVRLDEGRIHNMRINQVQAMIPDLMHSSEILSITGEAHGATQDALRFIDNSPVSGWINHMTKPMTANGNGKLALKFTLPLRYPERHKVLGSYQFFDNRIENKDNWPALEHVNGTLGFSETTLSGRDIQARLFGGPARINLQSHGSALQITLSGIADAPTASRAYYEALAPYVQGRSAWQAHITMKDKNAEIKLNSDLSGVAVALPQPLSKSATETRPLQLESAPYSENMTRIKLSYGARLSGQFLRKADGGIERGSVHMGGASQLPESPGIWLSGDVPYLDLDAWRTVYNRLAPKTAGGQAAESYSIAGVDLTMTSAELWDRRFNAVKLSARNKAEAWQANINAQEVNGQLMWLPQGRGKLVARLKHFTFPEDRPTKVAGAEPVETHAADMPVLDVTADNIVYEQKNLGSLELLAVPKNRDWHIQKFKLHSAEGDISGEGMWQDAQPRSLTKMDLSLETQDLGKFLARWGYPEKVARGSAKLQGQLAWAGGPASLDFSTLSGSLTLEAKNGRFLKIEPGIGKLIGILSLQALPRRITLDFRDVFSEGFSFDTISANVKIKQGVASSTDFMMQGPAAKVSMRGETDLDKETQNLRVKVMPGLAESVAVAGTLLGGPVVGLATYVVQKALQNPFDQLAAYEYNVTGTWDDPIVTKVPRPDTTTNPQ